MAETSSHYGRNYDIAEIRKSFQTTEEAENNPTENADFSFSFLKIRMILALLILAAFLLCHFTDYQFYGYDTRYLLEKISDNHYYTNLQEYVTMN